MKFPVSLKSKKSGKADVKSYDVVVIGSGSGMIAVDMSLEAGYKVALIDKGPAGGTCLNVGCIPSKMLIAAADRIMEIREADKFGIHASIIDIDFTKIMQDMQKEVAPDHHSILEYLKTQDSFDYYEGVGRFVSDNAIEVNGHVIAGETIFIVSGARPAIPVIPGLNDADYLTNETVLQLTDIPRHIAIIGGGYIAVEYGHFFSALGAAVTIIQDQSRLIPHEEPEISELLRVELQKRMSIHVNTTIQKVQKEESGYLITISGAASRPKQFHASHIMAAVGRRSNADLLEVQNAGIQTDQAGFIRVDDELRTSRKGIWAFGDAIGKQMFRHAANAEAQTAWQNALNGKKEKFRHDLVPRGIFTYPPIASVGMTEAQAGAAHDIYVGKAPYNATAMGAALREERGFAKLIVDRKNMDILGFHIFGPHASILIQEVVNAMASGGQAGMLLSGIHIHPALTELIIKTFSNLAESVASAE